MALHSILLTGATGFVGQHMLATLRLTHPNTTIHCGSFDVTDLAATRSAFIASSPDACLHLAAVAAVRDAQRNPDRAWQVNLHGTLNMARAVMEHAPNCRFLFASSADAYGASFRSGSAVNETVPLAPLNTYAATKAAADLAVGALAAEGLRAVRLRAFNHIGRGQADTFAIPAFAHQIARIALGKQEPVLRVGALDSSRDFLDVRDVCAAYAACLERDADLPAGIVLNISSGTPRRLGDVLERLLALSGVQAKIEIDSARLRPVEIATTCGDSSAARRLLQWVPHFSWDQTLSDVLADWRQRVDQEPH